MSNIPPSGSSASKTSQPAADLSKVTSFNNIVKELLPRFPALQEVGDIAYWLLGSWWFESNWRLHFPRTGSNGLITVSSLHYTPTVPAYESTQGVATVRGSSTLIGTSYQYNSVIQSKWNDPAVTPQIRANIKEGWYPHGITAVMGCYHVKGTTNNLGEWRKYSEAVGLIEELGLEVNPGESIYENLFLQDDEASWKRSIASGMIIFNCKYKAFRKNRGPAAALQEALGAYVGKRGAADLNGMTPEARIAQLNQSSAGFKVALQKIGVTRTGDTTVLIDTSDKSASPGGATTVANNTPAPATTNSGQTGNSEKSPGCQV